jgi:hypothetical protein
VYSCSPQAGLSWKCKDAAAAAADDDDDDDAPAAADDDDDEKPLQHIFGGNQKLPIAPNHMCLE